MYRKMTLEQIKKIHFPEYTNTLIAMVLRQKMKVFCYLDYDKGKTYYILSDEQFTQLEKILKNF